MNLLVQKFRLLKNTELKSTSSRLLIASDTKIHLEKGAKIIINQGAFKLGGSHPLSKGMPSLGKTMLVARENSTVIINGDVFIASGSYISLEKGSCLVFGGGNYIGHNNKIIVYKETRIGENSSSSWDVTLMEDDSHDLYQIDGKVIPKNYKKMCIGKNVGLQMNVTVPRGISIGDNSLIGANTVLRKDVSADTLVYESSSLRERYGISAGLQFI